MLKLLLAERDNFSPKKFYLPNKRPGSFSFPIMDTRMPGFRLGIDEIHSLSYILVREKYPPPNKFGHPSRVILQMSKLIS